MMEPEYMPLYTRAKDLDRSPTGTHLSQSGVKSGLLNRTSARVGQGQDNTDLQWHSCWFAATLFSHTVLHAVTNLEWKITGGMFHFKPTTEFRNGRPFTLRKVYTVLEDMSGGRSF